VKNLALSLSVALFPFLAAAAGELPANTWVKVGAKAVSYTHLTLPTSDLV